MNTALNRTSVALLTNKSGGSVAQGDVVIVDSANATAFTTTTTSAYVSGFVGVVLEPNGIASNATGTIAFGGYVPVVNLSGSASLGDVFKTHSVAKQAVRHAGPIVAGDFGQVLGTGTTPAALLWGAPAGGGGGGSSTFAADTDVSISGLANLDQIQYQTGDSKYHNVPGGMVRLAQTVLGAGAASITFSSISAAYSALMLVIDGRSDAAATLEALNLQFNGDTAGNYDWAYVTGNNSAASAGNAVAASAAQAGYVTAATAPANASAQLVVTIPNYAGTTFHKGLTASGNLKTAASSAGLFSLIFAGWWRSTAAINAILIAPAAGNLIIGTQATLYGLV